MLYLLTKMAEHVAGLSDVESVNLRFSTQYKENGYTNDQLIVHFKKDSNKIRKESAIYLFSITRQQWEYWDAIEQIKGA